MQQTSPGSQISDDDRVVLTFLGLFALPGLLGAAGYLWSHGLDWLVQHHVLIGAAADPLLPIPGCAGAGLDGARLAIAAGLLAIGLVVTVSAIRWALVRRRYSTAAA